MDDATIRHHAEAHANSVVSGDMAAVAGDILPEALPKLASMAGQMPAPVERAEVASIDLAGDGATVRIAYTGGDKTVTVESHWVDKGDRPYIDEAKVL